MPSGPIRLRRSLPALLVLAAAACAGRREPPVGVADAPRGAAGASGGRGGVGVFVSPTQIYQDLGLIAASGGGVPFVGTLGYLAGNGTDSTLAVVALSFPNRVITFGREGDRYRGTYEVRLDLKQGASTVRHVEAQEVVRVASFKETTRNDESVIFQQILSVPPGAYTLALSVRDAGSVRASTYEAAVQVPRLGPGAVGTPVAVYEATPRARADSLPTFVTSPRATAVFGRDTALSVYAEGYGGGVEALPVSAVVRGEKGLVLWADTVLLPRRSAGTVPLYSGTFRVPVARMGVGPSTLVVRRLDDGRAAGADSGRAPVFVSFGEELPVATFDEMLSYLRWFAPAGRLKALRDTTPEARAAAWAAFLKDTDPVPGTATHEGLKEYFARVQLANVRYREEGGPGWQTDRGMVYVSLGDPDNLFEPNPGEIAQRGRMQIWEYNRYQTRLFFVDQSGFGRWRLTPQSEAEFQQLVRRVQKP